MCIVEDFESLITPGMVLGGCWEVGEILGRGCFGCIYECENKTSGLRAAVKLCLEEDSDANLSFEKEIMDVASTKNCQYLVRAYDFGSFEEMEYLVMERFGTNLMVQCRQMQDPLYLMVMSLQMVRAVKEFHELGYCHNDIKLANFVCAGNWNPEVPFLRLIDYGLATEIRSEKAGIRTDGPLLCALDSVMPSAQSVWRDLENVLDSVMEVANSHHDDLESTLNENVVLPSCFIGLRQFVNYLGTCDRSGPPDYAAIEGYLTENIKKLMGPERPLSSCAPESSVKPSKSRRGE